MTGEKSSVKISQPPPTEAELQTLVVSLAGRRPTPGEVQEVVARGRAMHRRPPLFYRGDTEFDIERVGPRCDRATDGERATFLFDTRVRGNSAAGHLYGVGLQTAEKAALVDYLKTFGTRGER